MRSRDVNLFVRIVEGTSQAPKELGELVGRAKTKKCAKPLEYRHNCLFCNTHVNGTAPEEGRVVEVAAGVKYFRGYTTKEDELCAVCTACNEEQKISERVYSIKELLKM